MFGIEEYYEELLLEAKSPEEIKKILEYQFVSGKGVPEDIFEGVFNIDPTKKKSYTRWVLSQWDTYSQQISKALSNGTLERMFKTFKERAAQGLDLTNIENFGRAMEYIPNIDPCLTKEGDPNAPENNFDIMFESPEWVVAVPHTYEADKKLGRGCNWCTAGAYGDNDSYWKRYSSAGPLWVNFDKRKKEVAPKDGKEYPYKRYQLLFEWSNWCGELMDAFDNRISFNEIDMPSDVVEFYGQQNEKYKEIIENGAMDPEDAYEEWNEWRYGECRVILNVGDYYLSLYPEDDPDIGPNDNYTLYLYDENDMNDPISTSHSFGKGDYDYLVARMPNHYAAILKDDNDDCLFAFYNDQRYSSFDYFDIEGFEDIGNEFYFISTYRDGSYIMPTSDDISESDDFAKLPDCVESVETICVNTQLSTAAYEGGVDGLDGTFIEVHDDFSNCVFLFYYDGSNTLRKLIMYDSPVGGHYTGTVENGKLYIQGRVGNYCFTGDEDIEGESIKVVENINQRHYIVKERGLGMNVYDTQTKKLLFDECYDSINTMSSSYITCSKNSKSIVYWLQENKFVTDWFNDGDLDTSGFCGHAFVVKRNDWYELYSTQLGKKIITSLTRPAEKTSANNDKYYLVKTEKMGFNMLNAVTWKLMINPPEPFETYGLMEVTNIFLGAPSRDGGKVYVYNYTTGKLLFDNCTQGNGFPKKLYGLRMGLKFEDGTFNILDRYGELMLPKNVEKLAISNDSICMGIEDGGRLWAGFFGNNSIGLMPEGGIELEGNGLYVDRLMTNMADMEYSGASFRLNWGGGNFYITNTEGRRFPAEQDEWWRSEVLPLIDPSVSRVQENFNRVYKSIIDAELRRYRDDD